MYTQNCPAIRAAPSGDLIFQVCFQTNLLYCIEIPDETCLVSGPVPLIDMFKHDAGKQLTIRAQLRFDILQLFTVLYPATQPGFGDIQISMMAPMASVFLLPEKCEACSAVDPAWCDQCFIEMDNCIHRFL